MLCSVYTPTHRPDHLLAAYASLAGQRGGVEWEWVLALNGSGEVPSEIAQDERVRVLEAPAELEGNVGALKKFCCEQAAGDVYVELDHDDELSFDALHCIADVLHGEPNAMVFSDFAQVREGSHSFGEAFPPAHGWSARIDEAFGGVIAVEAPECTARTLCEIFYAPNHVRAWSRKAYDKSGGYRSLPLCDDHDLLIRTYVCGTPMVRVPRVLYRQRLHAQQTQLVRNAEIQTRQAKLCADWTPQLVAEWCRRKQLPAFDLGGAHGGAAGFIAYDLHSATVRGDLLEDLPKLPDNSVGAFRAYDFLEHIPAARVVELMNEVYRVLVPGGWLLTRTPSSEGRGAFQDPTHSSFWNSNSWWYYTRAEQAKYVPAIKARFQAVRIEDHFPSDWHKAHCIPYVDADLCALKGQHTYGLNPFGE